MGKPKISTIVPVYNCENYLENTVYSLINQSVFEDIEILLIDDGSTDSSRYLTEKFSLDYDNIYSFHKENEGLTFTRNYGIDRARGEYIHFMDADDYIPPEAYEKLYSLADKYSHDIVSGHFLRFDEKKIWRLDISEFVKKQMTESIPSTTLNDFTYLTWDSVCWNKLYKRDFLKKHDIKFPYERITYEDNVFSIESYIKAESVGFLNEDIYYWRQHSDNSSLSVKNLKTTIADRFKIMKMVDDVMAENRCSEEIRELKYLKWLVNDLKLMLLSLPDLERQYHNVFFKEARKTLKMGPEKIIPKLDNYHKLLYTIVLKGDFEDLSEFKRSYKSQKLEKFNIHSFDDYAESAMLNVSAVSLTAGEDCLDIKFKKHHWAEITKAELMSLNQRHDCKIDGDKISIPLNLLGIDSNMIKVTGNIGDSKKEEYLLSDLSKTLIFEDYDLESGYGVENVFKITKRLKNNVNIDIGDVSLTDGNLVFTFSSDEKISGITMKNKVSEDKFRYPVGNDTFKIHYLDLLKSPIQDWVLETDNFNRIKTKKYEFFKDHNLISVKNKDNKVNINLKIVDKVRLISDLKNDKSRLKSQNRKLKKELGQYKSRKAVRFADKIRKVL